MSQCIKSSRRHFHAPYQLSKQVLNYINKTKLIFFYFPSSASSSASIFSLFEPITSVISGLLLFNESIDIKKIIGCLVIFIAV
ncbi:MAG: EamA family transporter, partial [Clostridiales bacterium]|nr:EamA family transporter [Clostridiales bacterium]